MKTINTLISDKQDIELRDICEQGGFTLSEFVRQAIRIKLRDERIILNQGKKEI